MTKDQQSKFYQLNDAYECVNKNDPELIYCAKSLLNLMKLRENYLYKIENPIEECNKSVKTLFIDFINNYKLVASFLNDKKVYQFCNERLVLLEMKFKLYIINYEKAELEEQKFTKYRDFYNVLKVDTHIHASACMQQLQLLEYIRNKKDDPALKAIINECNINDNFNIDNLNVQSTREINHRFDKFDHKYSPFNQQKLRSIFLKYNNEFEGKYFAELIKLVTNDEINRYHKFELRISIVGKSKDEWIKLARWANKHQIKNNKWLIQIIRDVYQTIKREGKINCFQDMLDNIFEPLFNASDNPENEESAEINKFLLNVSGFDSVSDESGYEDELNEHAPLPNEWTSDDDPHYVYYIYFMYENIKKLNMKRKLKGQNTFKLRPHCGEAGSIKHLIAGFLLAENISHGIVLKRSPVLIYLYYLCQIGISMSPLSNSSLFLKGYTDNPFYYYHKIGLKISLSTDDPLIFHYSKDPLLEEYVTAKHAWKLNSADMCELARSSVLISGFTKEEMKKWTTDYDENNILKTNVPQIRLKYRQDNLMNEIKCIYSNSDELII